MYSSIINLCIEDICIHEKIPILEDVIFSLYAWLYQVEGAHFVIWWTYSLFKWGKILIIGF